MWLAVELEVPKRPIIGLHYPLSWSNRFCGERGKSNYLVTNVRVPWQRDFCFNIFPFSWPKVTVVTREEGEEKGWRSNKNKIPKLSYLDIYLKNQHIHFLVHGHFFWSTFSLHLVRGPKNFKLHFFRNQTMEL